MPFYPSSPIIRYTPPTCILEVYGKNLFSLPVNPNTDANNIRFKLHFDDPRLPQEEKETITGDRNLLLILREEVNNYISNYVRKKAIKPNRESHQQLTLNNKNSEKNHFTFVEQGLCNHQLCYCADQKKMINLSNTQLFDLANALENYYQQSPQIHQQRNRNFWRKLSLTISCLGILTLLGGLWWWRNQQQITQQANQSQQDSLEVDSDSTQPNNLDEVIPPSAIDSSEVPEVIIPEETEEMKNRETLPPPPPTLTQPPIPENQEQNTNLNTTTLVNNNLENETTRVAPINTTPQEILPPPSSPPLPPPPPVIPTQPENNVIAINNNPNNNTESLSPPSLPPSLPPSSNIQSISPSSNQNQTPPRLNRLPVIESSNSQTSADNQINNNSANNQTEINSVAINKSPNLTPQPQSTTTTTIAKSSTSTNYLVTQDVKQYFQGKWQPPDNLQQSIEYRLLINENGSLSRITPLGQSAQIFLDVTGMPLLGQTLSSSAQESVTVRLILSPDGEVRTFQE